jgi:putative DNA primase/helicase
MNSQESIIYGEANKLVRKQLEKGYQLIGLHTYSTDMNIPVFWRIRLAKQGEKLILPMHQSENGQFILKEPDFHGKKKPIYRLYELTQSSCDTVYIVEGESCADKLINLGLIATTSGSWNSARNADWSYLQGREILIWHDADDAGLKYAEHVTEILLEIGCSVKWIDVDKLSPPDGGDCIDWLTDFPDATKKDIQKLPVISPPKTNNGGAGTNFDSSYPRFELRENGVFYCKDADASVWLCSWLTIRALTRDANSINWGRVLEFKDADQNTRQWTMPMELVGGNGDELAKELLRLGLRIAPGIPIKKLLIEYITNSETTDRARCVLSTGWHGNCFVLPHKVFGISDEIVLLQSDSHIATDYCLSGCLLDWQKNVAEKCIGNSRLIFSVSLAFAAPLIHIARAESGGFHLRGESSAGKSTALIVGASVWGGRSYVQNWRATDNGLEGLALQHNDTLLVLDELSQIDPRYAGEVAYMLANGQGKARAGKSGAARPRYTWRLLFLSSGEISLSSHMMEAGKKTKAGQEIRMVDIPADAGNQIGIFEKLHEFSQPNTFADYLKVACDKHHGIAGDSFLSKLVFEDSLALHTKIQNLHHEFMQQIPEQTHGQIKRVAQRFALVAAAGEIASELGITGWKKGYASVAAKKCFEDWLSAREGNLASHEHDATLEQVRHFFQENASRFDVFDSEQVFVNRLIPQRCAGFRSSSGDFYVFPKTFRDEVCKGLGSPKDVIKIVEKNGWLIADAKAKTPYSSIWVATQSKTIRLYHFSSKVIGESSVT